MHNCFFGEWEDIRRYGNNSLVFRYGSDTFAVFREVYTFTAATLPDFGRPMRSVVLPAMSVGACKCHDRRSASCRAVLNVHQK